MTGSFVNSDAPGLPTGFSVEWDSIQPTNVPNQAKHNDYEPKIKAVTPWNCFKCIGRITNLNTLDGFKVRHNKYYGGFS